VAERVRNRTPALPPPATYAGVRTPTTCVRDREERLALVQALDEAHERLKAAARPRRGDDGRQLTFEVPS
jgi:hypothetical protein